MSSDTVNDPKSAAVEVAADPAEPSPPLTLLDVLRTTPAAGEEDGNDFPRQRDFPRDIDL